MTLIELDGVNYKYTEWQIVGEFKHYKSPGFNSSIKLALELARTSYNKRSPTRLDFRLWSEYIAQAVKKIPMSATGGPIDAIAYLDVFTHKALAQIQVRDPETDQSIVIIAPKNK